MYEDILEDIFHLSRAFWRYLEDVFAKRLEEVLTRRLENVLKIYLQDEHSRPNQDVLKTSSEDGTLFFIRTSKIGP